MNRDELDQERPVPGVPVRQRQPSTVVRDGSGQLVRVHAWPAPGWRPGSRLRAIRAAEGLIRELAAVDPRTATRTELRALVELAGEIAADLGATEREA